MKNNSQRKKFFSCYVVSENERAIQCAEIISRHGQCLRGIISSYPAVKWWADQHNIPVFDSFDSFLETDQIAEYDYLFSMINTKVMPERLICQPKVWAINYHDSLLPKYAGVNATAWAILNGENKHGVTWHVMANKIDIGDILIQEEIAIDEDETTLSLNLKCYQKGLELFDKLIEQLGEGTVSKTPQNLSNRTFYRRADKPPNSGFVDWKWPAEEIYRFYRALNFGGYENIFDVIKFIYCADIYSFNKIKVLDTNTDSSPGTILSLTDQGIRLSTGSYDILIAEISSITGKSYSCEELAVGKGFSVGKQFSFPNMEMFRSLQKYSYKISQYEQYWVKYLARIENPNQYLFNFLNIKSEDQMEPIKQNAICKFPDNLISSAQLFQDANADFSHLLFAVLLIYLYRLNLNEPIAIWLTTEMHLVDQEVTKVISSRVPFVAELDCRANLGNTLQSIVNDFEQQTKYLSFFNDVFIRYPNLSNTANKIGINIQIIESNLLPYVSITDELTFIIVKDKSELQIHFLPSENQRCFILPNPQIIKKHLLNIFNEIKEMRNLIIGDLRLVDQNELFSIINAIAKPLGNITQLTVHELFEQQVLTNQHREAVRAFGQVITYQRLNEQANQLARYLLKLIPSNQSQVIAIALDRSIEQFISILAILKAGHFYLPLDITYPKERIDYILQDTLLNVLLTKSNYLDKFTNYNGELLALDKLEQIVSEEKADNLDIKIPLTNPAYVIYTSGSTGRPKGVVINHLGLTNLSSVQSKCFDIQEGDNVLQLASLSFDASVSEWSTTLTRGACLCLLAGGSQPVIEQLLEALNFYQIHIATIPPSLLNLIPKNLLHNLKSLIVAGERCPNELIKYWAPKITMFNAYGPTENTVCATIARCSENKSGSNIGNTIPNVQIYLLDQNLCVVPYGAIGEICIAGVGLANGYWGNNPINNDKFINWTNTSSEFIRLYRSGDLGLLLPSGEIEYRGRKDSQIKLHAHRIEPGEIEACLESNPLVKQAVVLMKEDGENSKQLLAFVIKNTNLEATTVNIVPTLIDYLRTKLPWYMVPNKIVTLNSFPLTFSGKIDKDQLKKIKSTVENEKEDDHSESLEKRLMAIWSDLLGIKEIGLDDDFFQLGGDSIIAIQLVAAAQRAGINFDITKIFDYPTIAQLSIIIRDAGPNHSGLTQEDIVDANHPVENWINLSPIQNWFFQQKQADINFYCQTIFLEVKQAVNVDAIKICLNQLLKNYDVFYFHFEQVNGNWQQVMRADILASQSSDEFIECLTLNKNKQLEETLPLQARLLAASMDIENGKLFKACLFIDENSNLTHILFVAHHLIVDSVSWRVLLEDLNLIYAQFINNEKFDLKRKVYPYYKWCNQLKIYAESSELKSQSPFWLNVLTSKQNTFFTDIKSQKTMRTNIESILQVVDEEKTRKIITLASRVYNCSIQELLLTFLALSFGNMNGEYYVKLTLEGHGREKIDYNYDPSNVVGWFTSTFPVYLDFEDISPLNLSACIDKVKNKLNLIPKKGMGYGVLKYCGAGPEIAKIQSYDEPQIGFNYLGQWDNFSTKSDLFKISDLTEVLILSERNHQAHPLEILCSIQNGKLYIYWQYDKIQLKDETLQRLTTYFYHCMESIIDSSQKNSRAVKYKSDNFKLIKLSDEQLNDVFAEIDGIEDIYPLSPMQYGHFFYALYKPKSSAYLVQHLFKLTGKINPIYLKRAWISLVKNYSVFRTAFAWKGLDQPLQYVLQNAELPWEFYDWSLLKTHTQQEYLEQIIKDDRCNAFHLNKAPLMRFKLFKITENEYYLLWTFHHLLIDGWCKSILFSNLMLAYHQYEQIGQSNIPIGKPYVNFIEWLNSQDRAGPEIFWKKYLADLNKENSFISQSTINDDANEQYSYYYLNLEEEIITSLKIFTKKNGITLGVLLQCIWGLTLSRFCKSNDIVFGVTISGRTANLPNIDQMVGLFINAVPIRMKTNPQMDLLQLLKGVQSDLIAIQQYGYISLSDISKWAGVGTKFLFDTLFTVQNFPRVKMKDDSDFTLETIREIEQNELPLSINVIFQESDILLRFSYQAAILNSHLITSLASFYKNSLHKIAAVEENTV